MDALLRGKTPFFLITGFLGSGKTTFLKRILQQYSGTKKLAIVQNEFAESGVDGSELRRTGAQFELLEVNRGSVFCVCLLGDFLASLNRFVQTTHPDAVFLEATGLADPIAIAQLFTASPLKDTMYLAHSYCIVDVRTFSMIVKTVQRAVHQVRIADVVVCNKVDADAGEKVKSVEQEIRSYNPFATIVKTTYCDIELETLFDLHGATVAQSRITEHEAIPSAQRPPINSCVIRHADPVDPVAFEKLMAELTQGTVRFKGYVRLTDGSGRAVQSVFGETKVEVIPRFFNPTELVAMGENLDCDKWKRRFELIVSQ